MSLPIDKTLSWLRIGSVPLLLIASSIVAVWLGSRPQVNPGVPSPPVPQFSIDLSKITHPLTMEEQKNRALEIYRDPFSLSQTARPTLNKVNLRSIHLDLVVISPRKKLCWINGQMMKEGEKTNYYTLEKIDTNGVWYTTRAGKYFLRTGESILIDNSGIFHTEKNKGTVEPKPEK